MGKRHDSIGVKQVIPYEWMRRTANLLLAGMDAKEVRQELHAALTDQRKKVQSGERSAWTRTFLVNNLMTIWTSPDAELAALRDTALTCLRDHPAMELAIHWAMISATYPFWFNVARQTGRLLSLQEQATQAQIVSRVKEQYGDRQTVSRYARFVIRSFVGWGVLNDSTTTGRYEKAMPIAIADHNLAVLMLRAALLAMPDGKAPLGVLLNSPAFFPFHLPVTSGESIARSSRCIKVVRYGLDEELLALTV